MKCFLLWRHLSPYTEDSLYLGAFSTAAGAEEARAGYVEATSKEDDHAEQAYMDVDLAKDVRVKVFDVEDGATGSLVWLAVARSEGFGQAAMRLVAMRFELGTLAGIVHEQGIHGFECPLFFPLVLNQWTPRGVSAAWQGFCSDCLKVPEAWVIVGSRALPVPADPDAVPEDVRAVLAALPRPPDSSRSSRFHAAVCALAKVLEREDGFVQQFAHAKFVAAVEPRTLARLQCLWCHPEAFQESCSLFIDFVRRCGFAEHADRLAQNLV